MVVLAGQWEQQGRGRLRATEAAEERVINCTVLTGKPQTTYSTVEFSVNTWPPVTPARETNEGHERYNRGGRHVHRYTFFFLFFFSLSLTTGSVNRVSGSHVMNIYCIAWWGGNYADLVFVLFCQLVRNL